MKKLLSMIFAVATLFASCSKEIDNTTPGGAESGAAAVQFKLSTSQSSVVTYAVIATTPEWAVNTDRKSVV